MWLGGLAVDLLMLSKQAYKLDQAEVMLDNSPTAPRWVVRSIPVESFQYRPTFWLYLGADMVRLLRRFRIELNKPDRDFSGYSLVNDGSSTY